MKRTRCPAAAGRQVEAEARELRLRQLESRVPQPAAAAVRHLVEAHRVVGYLGVEAEELLAAPLAVGELETLAGLEHRAVDLDHRLVGGAGLRQGLGFEHDRRLPPGNGDAISLRRPGDALDILAADYCKAMSNLWVPFVGVGLLYAEGYFHQELDADGWQRERNDRIDPDALGVRPTGVEIHVDLAGVDATLNAIRPNQLPLADAGVDQEVELGNLRARGVPVNDATVNVTVLSAPPSTWALIV